MDDDWETLAGGDLKGGDGDWEELASDNFQKESPGNWDNEDPIPNPQKISEDQEEDWESQPNIPQSQPNIPQLKTTQPTTKLQEVDEDWEAEKPWVAPVKAEGSFEEMEENWDTPTNWEVPKSAPRNEDKAPKVKKAKKAKNEQAGQREEEREVSAEERLRMRMEGEARAREADLVFARDLFAGVEDEGKYARKESGAKAMEVLVGAEPREEKEFQELARALGKRVEEVDVEFQLGVLKEVFKSVVSALDPDDIIEIVKVITVQLNEKTKNKATKIVAKGKPKVNISSKKDIEVKSKDAFGALEGPDYDDGYDFM